MRPIRFVVPFPPGTTTDVVAPVAHLGDVPYFLTANPALPATNVQEFIAYARANPGKVHYASVGNFSMGHLAGEILKKTAGFDMVHVPYKGSTLALIDLLAGRIQLNISTIPVRRRSPSC